MITIVRKYHLDRVELVVVLHYVNLVQHHRVILKHNCTRKINTCIYLKRHSHDYWKVHTYFIARSEFCEPELSFDFRRSVEWASC